MPLSKATNWGWASAPIGSYATEIRDRPNGGDKNFAIEAYYDFAVTDNITITPAVFWVDDANGKDQVDGANKFGGLVKTTFKF